jgi:hypothetical protein
MTNRYPGKCARCGLSVPAGTGKLEKRGERWIVYHDGPCPEITSGLGIGGAGSDDYNIHTEADRGGAGYIPGSEPAGMQVCPAGTTYGQSSPGARCARCGASADWNPGAGENLCPRHWDEY